MKAVNRLYVVGIGPGAAEEMTLRAARTLERSEVIVGYGVYVDLVRPLFPGKTYLTTPMRREVERCRMAIDATRSGKAVAMICSGDAGVYGMAGLVIEMSAGMDDVCVEVVPGVTAALSGAALLGAPLGHDFAVISLSDALTPWEAIEKRLLLAAEAGLCIALYNPASRRRPEGLARACDVLLKVLPADTVCGVAANIAREGESQRAMTLAALRDHPADMFTTAFIGSANTRIVGSRIVTPRGYSSAAED